jgi:DNA-binding MarR family transcriptional regulator
VTWLSEYEHDAWRVMVAVHARLVSRLDAELQATHAISLRDYEVLMHLSEADGASLRMVELADLLVVSPSGLTRRLDGLVRDGLVRRQACLSDRRGTLAVLSEAGWAVLEEAAPTHLAGVRRYVFDPLDDDQLQRLTEGLRLIRTALDATDRPGNSGPGPASERRGTPGTGPVNDRRSTPAPGPVTDRRHNTSPSPATGQTSPSDPGPAPAP